jgi:hypothetical protein
MDPFAASTGSIKDPKEANGSLMEWIRGGCLSHVTLLHLPFMTSDDLYHAQREAQKPRRVLAGMVCITLNGQRARQRQTPPNECGR